MPDYDTTVFFYNPNIFPFVEYKRRFNEQRRFISDVHNDVKLIEGEYDFKKFKNVISGLEHLPENSERCKKCYELRLEETAKVAASHGFDCFTTTLTLSSKKNADNINEIAKTIARKYSIKRLWSDFKKDDGYNRSIELCNEYNLYRQNYCGCNPCDWGKEEYETTK